MLQVHTRYRLAGGEDRVVEAERALLTSAGIQVDQVLFDNADLEESRSIAGDVRLAAAAVWSKPAVRAVRRAVEKHHPDVVHVHNTFVAASPAVLFAADQPRLAVVQTLHNYRLVCPAATAFRDGHPCIDCVGRPVPWPGVVHACVRDSHAQSAAAAATLTIHRALGTQRRHVDAYVVLTEFQRALLTRGGLPRRRMYLVPNFVETDPGLRLSTRSGLVYVGRLSEEKGTIPLLAAASMVPGAVRIAGTGPLLDAVQPAADRSEVSYLGSVTHADVLDQLRSSVAMLQPSVCFEGFPVAVAEAYATGTPVIASRIGSLGEIVEDGVTGLLAGPGDVADLANRMRWALDHPNEMRLMGDVARQRYEQRFSGPVHLEALLQVYRSAVARAAGDA